MIFILFFWAVFYLGVAKVVAVMWWDDRYKPGMIKRRWRDIRQDAMLAGLFWPITLIYCFLYDGLEPKDDE